MRRYAKKLNGLTGFQQETLLDALKEVEQEMKADGK